MQSCAITGGSDSERKADFKGSIGAGRWQTSRPGASDGLKQKAKLTMIKSRWQWFREMGALRNMLQGLGMAFVMMLPFTEPSRILEGWQLVTGGIIPALAPIVFVVMMFDVMMANILKDDGGPEQAIILRRVIRTHLTIGLVLIFLWLFSFRDVLVP